MKTVSKQLYKLYKATFNKLKKRASTKQTTLYFDMSAIAEENYGTGIARVVLSQLESLYTLDTKYEIIPVYLHIKNDEIAHYILDRNTLVASLNDDKACPKKDDIIYSPDIEYKNVDYAVKNKLYARYKIDGVKVAFLIHDLLPIQHSEFFLQGTDDEHKQFIQNISSISDIIFTTTNTLNKQLQEYQIKNMLKTPTIYTLPLGADLRVKTNKTASKTATSLNFLIVSTIEPRKGHNQLLEAFEILWSQTPISDQSPILTIVGKEGWMVKETMSKIKTHPLLNKKLFYKGYLSNQELAECYKNADCVIFASYAEGYGLPLIEAAHYNKPIITRDIPVFREVAGDYPIYFKDTKEPQEILEAIQTFIRSPQCKNKKLSSFNSITWKENATKLVKILESI